MAQHEHHQSALTTLAARYRLSGTPSGEHRLTGHLRTTLTNTLTLLWHQGHPSGTYTPDPAQRYWGDWGGALNMVFDLEIDFSSREPYTAGITRVHSITVSIALLPS